MSNTTGKAWYQSFTLWFNTGVVLVSLMELATFLLTDTLIPDPELFGVIMAFQTALAGLGNWLIRKYKTVEPVK